jgi:hypothetical protein
LLPLFVVLVLSIAVLVLALDVTTIPARAFRNTIEFHRHPCATQDSDIVIEYSEGVLRRLRETLGLNYQIDPQPGFEFWLHGFALYIADPCKPAQIRANSTAPYAAPWHH